MSDRIFKDDIGRVDVFAVVVFHVVGDEAGVFPVDRSKSCERLSKKQFKKRICSQIAVALCPSTAYETRTSRVLAFSGSSVKD